MRVFAVHDTEGNIARIITSPESVPPMLPSTLDPGQVLTEIDLPEGLIAEAGPDPVQGLLNVMEYYRVAAPDRRPAAIERKDQAR